MAKMDRELRWNPSLSEPAEEMVYDSFMEIRDMWRAHHTSSLNSKKEGWSTNWKRDITCLLAEVLSEAK